MSQVAESLMHEQAPTAAPVRLPNLEQLKQAFAEDGYLVFRGVVSPERLKQLHTQLSEAFEDAKRSGRLMAGGGTISGHLN